MFVTSIAIAVFVLRHFLDHSGREIPLHRRLKIYFLQCHRRTIRRLNEKIENEVRWIVVFFACEAMRSEVRQNTGGGAEIDALASIEKENGVEQFEDGITRLMDGKDDCICDGKEVGKKFKTMFRITYVLDETMCVNSSSHSELSMRQVLLEGMAVNMADGVRFSPVVGSSRKRTSGDRTSSMPILVRFLSPPETPRTKSVPTNVSAHA